MLTRAPLSASDNVVSVADHIDVTRDHGFHALRVKAVVRETADTCTFVFDVPGSLVDLFGYHPGQFCTVRATIDDDEVLRCYSMSSASGLDPDLAVTVKRVSGGLMSNWLHDHVGPGDTLELMRPSGVFVTGSDPAPLLGFCGGSGVTPLFSIVKHALATTERCVRLLVANRDRASVIFHAELTRLAAEYAGRFELHLHLDAESGYLDPVTVVGLVEGLAAPEVFICGPPPFMDLVEQALVGAGVDPQRIAIERFMGAGTPATSVATSATSVAEGEPTRELTIVLKGKKHVVAYVAGDSLLDAARRAGLKPPFSCELGNCASCMAMVGEGRATMRANNALTPAEVAEGWVLTCQALPVGRSVKVDYEHQ